MKRSFVKRSAGKKIDGQKDQWAKRSIVNRGDPRGISPGGTPGKIVFLIPPFPGENFPIPRGKLNKKLPEKVIFYYVISSFFIFWYIFGQLWLQICLIAMLFLSSGEYFYFLKIFAEYEKFVRIQDRKRWDWKISGKNLHFHGNIDVWCQD